MAACHEHRWPMSAIGDGNLALAQKASDLE
jgi:hypothetical protein